ncbi:uncharacterized protein LOC119084328 [Bradysia coprophila]|uniref:uncharacterized protein LOC119084328 n=1 Tax=Bradysia coprophila TaxID=38358 RepID=UPI00187DAB20|nr:uncharacterized protein LOC119084328 [Bradysia coprophila]XP_037050155.1 uncharacterized protein LOC119084328 [Bradysia coprophila]
MPRKFPPQRVPSRPTIQAFDNHLNYSKKLRSFALFIRSTLKWSCHNWRYILTYVVTLIVGFAIIHFEYMKKSHLDKIATYGGWGQFLILLVVYMGLGCTKHQAAVTDIPSPIFLVNLLKLMKIDNDTKTRIVEQAYAAVFMVFFCISPMVRNNMSLDPEQLGVHELIDRLLATALSIYTVSPTLSDSEIKCMIRTLSSQAVDEARHIAEEDRRTDVIKEISALQVQCDKYVLMQQRSFYKQWTTIIYVSMWICLIVVGLEVLGVDLNESHDLKTRCISMIVSTVTILVICLFSVIIVRYFEQIVSPYNDEYDLFGLNQSLNEKWAELSDLRTSSFSPQKHTGTQTITNSSSVTTIFKERTIFNNAGTAITVHIREELPIITRKINVEELKTDVIMFKAPQAKQ